MDDVVAVGMSRQKGRVGTEPVHELEKLRPEGGDVCGQNLDHGLDDSGTMHRLGDLDNIRQSGFEEDSELDLLAGLNEFLAEVIAELVAHDIGEEVEHGEHHGVAEVL